MKHEWDMGTHFCKRCGIAAQVAVENREPECPASPNVVGISHIISARRFRKMLGDIIPLA